MSDTRPNQKGRAESDLTPPLQLSSLDDRPGALPCQFTPWGAGIWRPCAFKSGDGCQMNPGRSKNPRPTAH